MGDKMSDKMEQYEVKEQIGKGSFGQAFLVIHRPTKQKMVMKKVRLARQTDAQRNASYREMELVQKLKHPFIVSCHDQWVERGHTICTVYGYCDGGDLSNLLHRKSRGKSHLPEDQLRKWYAQLALGLEYLHSNNILHRDLKSSNIFLTRHGDLQIGDFGLAKVLEEGEMSTSVVGTANYMCPELLSKMPYDYKCDIWSLGCILYELTALRPAFQAFNMAGLVTKIKKVQYAPLPSGYTPEWAEMVRSMLRKEPSERPSISELRKLPFMQQAFGEAEERAEELFRIAANGGVDPEAESPRSLLAEHSSKLGPLPPTPVRRASSHMPGTPQKCPGTSSPGQRPSTTQPGLRPEATRESVASEALNRPQTSQAQAQGVQRLVKPNRQPEPRSPLAGKPPLLRPMLVGVPGSPGSPMPGSPSSPSTPPAAAAAAADGTPLRRSADSALRRSAGSPGVPQRLANLAAEMHHQPTNFQPNPHRGGGGGSGGGRGGEGAGGARRSLHAEMSADEAGTHERRAHGWKEDTAMATPSRSGRESAYGDRTVRVDAAGKRVLALCHSLLQRGRLGELGQLLANFGDGEAGGGESAGADKKFCPFQLGDKVVVGKHRRLEGVIRYFGGVLFCDGDWVGIELESADGRNNGSVQGINYFTCKENCGLFVRASILQPESSVAKDRLASGTSKEPERNMF